jgi:uncharacterized protein YfaS (alpha-2-macroglobulin family)/uncharacterized protein YggU (UPF0235/DUF167 family)
MMDKKLIRWTGIGVIAVVVIVLGVYFLKGEEKAKFKTVDPGFSEFVAAIPSGFLSASNSIKIILVEPFENYETFSQEKLTDMFSFSPGVSGSARFINPTTIEFFPNEKLQSGQLYTVSFELGDLISVPGKFETLEFDFQVIKQVFSIRSEGLVTVESNNKMYSFQGTFIAVDNITNEEVEKIIKAELSGKDLKIQWIHGENSKEHSFKIENIERKDKAQELEISWNGKEIGVDTEGEFTEEIVALGDFKVTKIKVVQLPEQYVKIEFSDPIEPNQDLRGLIKAGTYVRLKYIIHANSIKAYPSEQLEGKQTLVVSKGIKSVFGYKLKNEFEEDISFTAEKPAVEFIGKGSILPSSDGLIVPFKSVSLNAVDVTIIKIFEDNIPQFLQVNDLDGMRELKRVGRKVHKEKINLQSDKFIDYSQWNTFYIDLGKMINADPGALYRVKLSFRKSYSTYGCESSTDDDDTQSITDLDDDWDEEEADESSWDNDYYYDYDYDYSNRENPCHKDYYRDNRFPERNIIASNYGIIAKTDKNNRVNVFVSDIRTTEPISEIEVEVLNYQQQVIGKGKTDGDGHVNIEASQKPYIVLAKKNKERGYLRLNGGSALSLSMFDVSGTENKKGIKGFIYGERGVWRPGDTLHLTFILEDKDNVLPASHPVVLEVTDAQGNLEKRMVKTSGIGDFYYFKLPTSEDVNTGNWQAKVTVGGAEFTKSLKVETIKPNRLKINLDFGTTKQLSVAEPIKGNLNVRWLHGAIARNLESKIQLTFNPMKTVFDKYRDYIFDDPASGFSPESQMIFDGRVDAEGNADFSASVDLENEAPGMLQAHFITKAYEEGGDFSIDHYTMPFAPYKTFVGIKTPKGDKARGMLLTDTKHKIDIATVDYKGNPVSRSGVNVKVYKLDWKWWWQTSEENLAYYIGQSYTNAIQEEDISTSNGRGTFEFEIKYPDWGRYLIRATDNSGHSTGKIVYVDWPGWAGRAQKDGAGGASVLSVTTDKSNYTTGETAKLTIPATAKGRALVSIEKGSKVLKQFWVELSKNEQVVDIDITEEMAPNVFLNVMLLQPHKHSENDLPIRLYGYTPILVENPKTVLKPKIKMPDELESEGTFTLEVEEENDKPMVYSIAVVDEGLLDLTRFQTPNPWGTFYAREALGIKTWDVFDDIIGAYGGKLEQVFAIGGDEGLGQDGKKSSNRFEPVVMYLGPFELKGGKSRKHTVKLPKYVGSVRTMVVAGKDGAYGITDKATPVKKPLMILATLPRKLSPGEKLNLPVTVFSMDKNLKNVQVKVEATDIFKLSSTSKTVSFSKPGDKDITFDIEVAKRLGKGKVRVFAKAGSYEADYEINIDIINPNEPITTVIDTVLEAGSNWQTAFDLPGIIGSNKAFLEVSNVPPIDLGKRLNYLIRYPHGCVEQTTSSVFPQLFLDKLTDLNKEQRKVIEKNVKAGIDRLSSFQLSDGGLGYWPGAQYSDDWGTSYAGHFMFEAEKQGYDLPSGFKANWIKYQRKRAQNWTDNNYNAQYQQVYRLYTLAVAGKAEISAMNRLKELKNLSVQTKWRLAATYALAGQPEIAKELIADAGTEVKEYNELGNTFGNDLRDKAMILEAMVLLDKKTEGVKLLEQISASLAEENWMSTQTISYCLIAASKYAGKQNESLKYSYTVGSKKEKVETNTPVSQKEINVEGKTKGALSVNNTGKDMLYVRVILTGIPEMGKETSSSSNLSVNVNYTDLKGKSVDESKAQQGEQVLIKVKVRNTGVTGKYENLALTIPVPSGWEIENARLFDMQASYSGDVPDYMDIRDDRAHLYFDLAQGSTKEFNVLCNISFLGDYYLPTIYCEAMYDKRISASVAGKWVRVVR